MEKFKNSLVKLFQKKKEFHKENIDKISKLIVDAALEKNLLVIVASHQQVSFPLEEINMIKIKNKGISLELK